MSVCKWFVKSTFYGAVSSYQQFCLLCIPKKTPVLYPFYSFVSCTDNFMQILNIEFPSGFTRHLAADLDVFVISISLPIYGSFSKKLLILIDR